MDNDVMLKSQTSGGLGSQLPDPACTDLADRRHTLQLPRSALNDGRLRALFGRASVFPSIHPGKSNVIKFPYGTGKPENFSAFLYGSLTAPPQSISFTYVRLAMIPAIARALYLFIRARRLNNQTDSPMAESYYVNFKVTTLFAAGVLLAFTSAVILTYAGHASVAGYIDPMVSLILSLYMLYNGVKQTVGNFKILMDLPLPEDEQLKIMNVITCEFDNYENVGNIYTRRSGRQRFLDIELYLDENMTIRETACLQSRMQGHLEEYFDGIKLKLIPLPHSHKAGN